MSLSAAGGYATLPLSSPQGRRQSSPSRDAMPDDLTNNLLKTIQRQLGSRWDALSVADRQLIAEVAVDASLLQTSALAVDPADPAAVAALAGEQRQIDAQLANIQSVAAAEVRSAFWQSFNAVAGVLLHIGLASVGVNPSLISAVADTIAVVSAKPPAMTAGVIAEGEDMANGGPNVDPAELPPPIEP
jgi:hypothetical protein